MLARRIAREAAIFGFYLLLTVAMTWPLATHLPTAIADMGDPLLVVWIIDWVGRALLHAPLHLFDAPMYYPGHYSLAYSENLIGVALVMLPFQLAGLTPVTVYNIAILIAFALSGYGAFVLARMITRSTAASLVAGIIYAFVPHKFDHLSHLQILFSGWLPLLLAALLAYWRKPSRRNALLIAAAFAMNGLTNVYYLLFGAAALVLTIAMLAIIDPRRGRRFWLTLAASLVAGGAILLPVLLPYRAVSKEYKMVRAESEALGGSLTPSQWLVATPRNRLYGSLGLGETHLHELQMFPGVMAVLLTIFGLAAARLQEPSPDFIPRPRRDLRWLDALIVLLGIFAYAGAVTDRIEWTWNGNQLFSMDRADIATTLLVIAIVARLTIRYPDARGGSEGRSLLGAASRSRISIEGWSAVLWIAIGFLGSLGLNAFLHGFLWRRIGIFQATRVSARWAIVAYVGLAATAAIGALALLQRCKGWRRHAMTCAILALTTFELWPVIRWEYLVPAPAPVYRWLRRESIEPIVELPLRDGMDYQYVLGLTTHERKTFNGVSGFEPPVSRQLSDLAYNLKYPAAFLRLLETHGCKLVIVHVHALGENAPLVRNWLARNLAAGHLAYVRKFDHDIGGDFVFAVTRNFRDYARYREPELPDAAGHLPRERLARMLAGLPTHSDAIIAKVEQPQPDEQFHGALRVRGWTFSPFTITRVTVLIDGGSVRVDAPLVDPRPDVTKDFSWYYFTPRPGFDVIIPQRPRGVPKRTEVQVEIEDEGHRVHRTRDINVDWEDAQ